MLLIFSYNAKPQAIHLFGIGLGISDYSFDFNHPPPFFSDKDFNINYAVTWSFFSVEVRQNLKYDHFFNNTLKSSSYLLLGFSTLKEKIFSFNMLIGGTYSFIPNQGEYAIVQRYYPPQIRPAIKLSFYIRLSKKRLIHMGFDSILSAYEYAYNTGSSGSSGNITLSALLSVNYLVSYQDKKKANELKNKIR